MNSYNIVSIDNPKSQSVEDFRRLRTNIQSLNSDKKLKTIMIASTSHKEGRTAVAANLAIQMAQAGNATVLVDCDLRNPSIHSLFKCSNDNGLCDFLTDETKLNRLVRYFGYENLYILTAGKPKYSASKLIDSKKLKELFELLKEDFDYIIIDTPPIMDVSDAQVISQYVDGVILVAIEGESNIETVKEGKRFLEKVNANILGVVLNKLKI